MRESRFFRNAPGKVRIVEVGPRDGLQNESAIVSTEDKVRLIKLLADSGLPEIEVSSFVSAQRIPQLADAAEVFALLPRLESPVFSALVPNQRGLERALESGVRKIALFTGASETFTQKNIGMTIEQSLETFREAAAAAFSARMSVRAYVSTAFVCPYEGKIEPDKVAAVVEQLADMKVDEIALADTIGRAAPDAVARLTERILTIVPAEKLAYHFHDTHGLALANVTTALKYGIATFDSAAGGVGGCPFAPGAAGNLATESLLELLHGMGIETGVDADKVHGAALFLRSKIGSC